MKYIVYLTINLKNGKIYVGVHKTQTPYKFDGYLGNGVYLPKTKPDFKVKIPSTPFKKAINKYGAKNFIRTTLCIFHNEEDAYKLEETLVTETFIKSKHTYNIKLGGMYSTSTTARIINQYDSEGKYLKTWDSITAAAIEFNIVSSCILESCTEKSITAAGYVWRYYKDNTDDVIVRNRVPSNKGDINAKPVVQYSKQGHRKKTFKSVAQAAKHLNISSRGIGQCCNCDENHKSSGGYQWRFESDNLKCLLPLDSMTSAKEVEQIYKDNIIGVYKSSNQAAKEIGFPKAGRNIRKACTQGSEYKGYFWRYKG